MQQLPSTEVYLGSLNYSFDFIEGDDLETYVDTLEFWVEISKILIDFSVT